MSYDFYRSFAPYCIKHYLHNCMRLFIYKSRVAFCLHLTHISIRRFSLLKLAQNVSNTWPGMKNHEQIGKS